jgi:hypothetical protein
MKITIKKEVPASLQWEDAPADQKTDKASRGQKKKGAEKSKTAIISKEVEIADELLDKVIAVIDEILDRTRDDLENRSWKKLDFPLVPFPFLDKYRDPDRYGIDDYWIGVWLNTDLQGVISERAKIINFLNQAEALWIEHDPVVNLLTGNFRGEKFELSIERDKLLAVRKEAVEHKEGKDTLEALFGLAPLDGSKKSVYYDRARNLDELLRDVELRNRCLDLLHWGREFGRGKFLKTSISERDGNDDLVLLLENLGLLRADWKGLKDQLAYKEIGARNIEVTIDGTKVSDLVDRAEGKNAFIRRQTLEVIARHLGDSATFDQLTKFLGSWGVPDSLIMPNTKWRMVEIVLIYYAASSHVENHKMLFKILEESVHPLMFGGDKERSLEVQDKFSTYMQYDGYCFSEGRVVKVDDDLVRKIAEREKARKDKPVSPELANLLSGFFAPPAPKPVLKSEPTEIKIVGMPELFFRNAEENKNSMPFAKEKIQLQTLEIKYDDDKATLSISGKKCSIPPFKNEHYFCRAMYEHAIGEPIDWSLIYEKMTGETPKNKEKWHSVYDTMQALNMRVKIGVNTDNDLFTWQEKTVKRNF